MTLPRAVDLLIEARWVVPVEPSGQVLESHAVVVDADRIVAIVPIAVGRALVALVRTGNPMIAAHPLAVSAGRIGAWAGLEQQPYRAGTSS